MAMAVGQKIRALRIQRGLTQHQLSEGIVTVSMVSQIESGKARPSHRVIEAIAERLCVPIQDLLIDIAIEKECESHKRLAESLIQAGKHERALSILRGLRDRMPNPVTQVELLHGLGICFTYVDDLPQANVHLVDSLERAIILQSSLHIGLSYYYLGQVAFRNREFSLAKWQLERAEAAFSRPQEDSLHLFDTRMLLGQALLELGEVKLAGATFESMRPLCSLASDPQRTADYYLNMALSQHALGEFATATTLASQADVLFELLGRSERANEAKLIAGIKDWSGESTDRFQNAEVLSCRISWVIAKAIESAVEGFLQSGQPNHAGRLLDNVMAHATDTEARSMQLLHCLQARVSMEQGHEPEAEQHLHLACNQTSNIGALPELVQIMGHFAKRLEATNQIQQAMNWYHILGNFLPAINISKCN